MNPALLLVMMLAGTSMLLLGVLSAVFDWLPVTSAVVLTVAGLAIETPAALAFVRSRRKPAEPARARK